MFLLLTIFFILFKDDKIIDEKHHICSPDFDRNKIDESIYKLKQQLTTPGFPKVPKTFNSTVASLKNESAELSPNMIPNFSSVKSSLYRHRNSAAKLPKLHCENAKEVQVPPDFEDFLLADYMNGNTRILVFCSKKARELMCQIKDYYGDGTFKSCSPPFTQLYTIHGDDGSTLNDTNVVPLVYALMSNRTAESYKILFSLIQSRIPEWNPIKFKTDFEKAAMKAITEIFPSTMFKGCYFHYNKAVWKKGRELGLVKSKDIKKKRMVSLSAVLPLLPQAEIRNGWDYIIRDENEDSDVANFKTYMEKQWLEDSFIKVWCAFGEKHRTTNALESWHHKLNSAVGEKGPNIMNLLHLLKEDASFYLTQNRKRSNQRPMAKRSEKYIRRDDFIQDAQIELTHGDISVGHFLEIMRC